MDDIPVSNLIRVSNKDYNSYRQSEDHTVSIAQSPEVVAMSRTHRLAFGQIVRERREELGLTQDKLARRIQGKRELISQIENANYSPPIDLLWKLSSALRMSAGDLITRTDHMALVLHRGSAA